MPYKAFISYSHAVDGKLAPALQRELQRFAKPLFKLRSISVFRDSSNLSVNPNLWESIERALQDSECLLLLASETSASSRWVRKEIETWLACHSIENLFLVLTDGHIEWDQEQGDFNWNRTTALPQTLLGRFTGEPLYLDVRWAHTQDDLSNRNPRFMDAIADLSAAVRKLPKETLIGDDVHEHRRLVRFRWTMVSGLVVLLLLALTAAFLAMRARELALIRQVSAEAQQHVSDRLDLACLLSLAAIRLAGASGHADDVEPKRSLFACVKHSPPLTTYLHGHGGPIRSVKFSRNGGMLASYDDRGVGILWDVRARRIIRRLPETGSIVAFTYDNRSIILAVAGKILTEDLATGAVSNSLDSGDYAVGWTDWPQLIPPVFGFLTPGDHSLSIFSNTHLLRFDLVRHTRLDERTVPESTSFVANQDGTIMARAENADLTVYRNGHWRRLENQNGVSLGLSPDGKLLASGGNNGIFLWNLDTFERIASFSEQQGVIYALAFSPDSKELISGGWDGAVRRWDLAGRSEVRPAFEGHSGPVYAVDVSPDGSIIATGGADHTIILWDPRIVRPLARPLVALGNVSRARSVAFSSDGKTIASANQDQIVLENLATSSVKSLPIPEKELGVMDIAFDPAGDWLGSVQFGGTVKFWRVGSEEVHSVQAPWAPLYGISFNPDSKNAAVVSMGNVTILPVPGPGAHKSSEDSNGHWQQVRFSPNGKLIAVAGPETGRPTAVTLLDVPALKPIARLESLEAIRSIAFSSDGKTLATGSNGGEITLWEVATRQRAATLSTQRVQVLSLAFSPDRRLLAAGSVDEGITLWDLGTRQPLGQPLMGNGSPVVSMAFSPDGKQLLSNGDRRGPMLWDLDLSSWELRACRVANRQLTAQEQTDYIGLNWADKLLLARYPDPCVVRR